MPTTSRTGYQSKREKGEKVWWPIGRTKSTIDRQNHTIREAAPSLARTAITTTISASDYR
jgi:hypothetical protein